MIINVAKNKRIEIKIKNGRELQLDHNIDAVKITSKNNEILSIDFYGNTYSIGDTIDITTDIIKTSYNIGYIKQTSDQSFDLICDKPTKSSIFLLPLISPKGSITKDFFYSSYYYNSYIRFEGQDDYNDGKHLFVVYRFFTSDYFMELEGFLRDNPNFIASFEPNKDLTVFVMEIPLTFQSDAKRLMKGQYSKISTTAKSKIITFHQAHVKSELYYILHKSPELRTKLEETLSCTIPEEIELCSKPELIKETYGF